MSLYSPYSNGPGISPHKYLSLETTVENVCQSTLGSTVGFSVDIRSQNYQQLRRLRGGTQIQPRQLSRRAYRCDQIQRNLPNSYENP